MLLFLGVVSLIGPVTYTDHQSVPFGFLRALIKQQVLAAGWCT
jgi:hypothetical protein